MARWKLTEPHYLNVPSSRWEQTAVDARTGKPTRKMYKVPMHLDPRVADDWNHKYPNNEMDGEIHVCWEGKGLPHDIVFEGEPTPGMVPLDEEAKIETAKYDWTPTQGIDEESQRAGFFARLGDDLINQMTEIRALKDTAPQAQGVEKLMEAMAAMMAQNQQLIALLAGKATSIGTVQDGDMTPLKVHPEPEQVVDEEEPLEEVEPTEAELAEATKAARAKEVQSRLKARQTVVERRL